MEGRRYVGVNNGRLRSELAEEVRRTFELEDFVSWSEKVAGVLNSRVEPNPVFKRFMPTCAPPANPVPKTISVDFLRFDSSLSLADGTECRLRHSSSDIDQSGTENRPAYKATFVIEGLPGKKDVALRLNVEYQPNQQRFWFTKDEGPSVLVGIADAETSSQKNFVDFLNSTQDVLLIGLDGGNVVYQDRKFYLVDHSHAEATLFDAIVRPDSAPSCVSEKGTKEELQAAVRSASAQFPRSAIFHAIADDRINFPFTDDVLICDDMGTECADFVSASFKRKQLAFIHAKTGTGTKISAAAFHEVVSLAMKNLAYLARGSESPEGAASWRSDRYWRRTRVPRLLRATPGLPQGQAIWKKIKAEIVESSNPELYVVLVTAGCCDVEALKDAPANPSGRSPEGAQLVHLLDGLSGYARQLGVRLAIYDLPYPSPKAKPGRGRKKSLHQ